MKIEVTDEDIARGEPRSALACPIACALRRAGMLDVSVSLTSITVGHLTYKPMPPEAKAFIRDFDAGAPVTPFAFSVDSSRLRR